MWRLEYENEATNLFNILPIVCLLFKNKTHKIIDAYTCSDKIDLIDLNKFISIFMQNVNRFLLGALVEVIENAINYHSE